MTLHAAAQLIKAGLVANKQARTGSVSMGFSFFTGGMVLTFCALESFSASVAFSMPSTTGYETFDFKAYQSARRFWDKMTILCSAAGIVADKSQGLFQRIEQMQQWRNLVTHAQPFEIEPTIIQSTTREPGKLHKKHHRKDYIRSVDAETAKLFYESTLEYIDLITAKTGIDPRASVSYKNLGEPEE
ncbi:hypothetical protein G6K88_14110 [Agrobacterium rhizogenes]|uniref:hypothetical protein n=1 Tax=Rhizobium rhizogenes TaxID=359 RepID=UPI00115D7E07|nr:hypothetical protein [Rhizobium rhizogenes]NTI03154.1 hypothetical protein [Rhizobium rhizogenes]NTI09958.1 hypothetical protein [Rhizobium rhizogenes]TRB21518.1 hypothetical protein EXN70_21665 [Rhizobium rhizogenes]